MKFSTIVSLTGLLGSTAQAHYAFSRLIVNDTEFDEWKYVRDVAYNKDYYMWFGKINPQFDIDSANITCGREAFKSAATTETADVLAGSKVGFHVQRDPEIASHGFTKIIHAGPTQAFLARAPNDDLKNFSGSDGDWFKIDAIYFARNDAPEWGTREHWLTYNQESVNFTIPLKTPPGKYLLRVENYAENGQFYANCAHINVIGPGGGEFTPEVHFAKFPGTYKWNDSRVFINVDDYPNPGDLEKNWSPPPPKLWTGEKYEPSASRVMGKKFMA